MVHRLTAGFTIVLVSVLVVLLLAGCAPGASAPSTTTEGTVTTTMAGETTVPPQGSDPGEATPTARATPEGEPAPDFTLALDGGGSFNLSDEMKPVLLVFWAEWCPKCSVEMPIVNSLAADYGGDVTFVAVAGRSTLEAAQARAAVWFPSDQIMWGYDDGLWQTYLIPGQPAGVLISSDNVIVDRWFGIIGKEAIMERLDTLVAAG